MSRLPLVLLLALMTTACATHRQDRDARPRMAALPECGSDQVIVRAANHGSIPADLLVAGQTVGTVNPGSSLSVQVHRVMYLRGAVRATPNPNQLDPTKGQPVGRRQGFGGMVYSASCAHPAAAAGNQAAQGG